MLVKESKYSLKRIDLFDMSLPIVIIGGGAAGVFAAGLIAAKNPSYKVILLEKTAQLLAKVRISGGGRCNVTHACFDPKLLVLNYPRGGKEMLGPFTRFGPRDMMTFFQERGVLLKIEEDGRVFPVSDDSQTIIDCLLMEAKKHQVEIRLQQAVQEIISSVGGFTIALKGGTQLQASSILLATGSSKQGYELASSLGHTIVEPVPSLFTFNIPTSPLLDLSGITIPNVELSIKGTALKQKGPLLLTHWGFSGPAALKLSAWAARFLHEALYKVDLQVKWLEGHSAEEAFHILSRCKEEHPSHLLSSENPFSLPRNLWKRLIEKMNLERRLAEISKKELRDFAHNLCHDVYHTDGKTTYKEEFVNCGGINLQEVNFKTMESKFCPGLYFAGEVLNIDGVTGGFNFQNAWTTAYLVATALSNCLRPLA